MKKYILPVYNRIKKDIVNNRVEISLFCGIFILFFVIFKEVCPTQILFGLPCPGCGLTRAGVLLLRFRFVQAWEMHPFIYVWLFFILYLCYNRYIRGKKAKALLPLLIVITISMFIFYIYRMCRYYPDVEPMVQKSESLFHSLLEVLQRRGMKK